MTQQSHYLGIYPEKTIIQRVMYQKLQCSLIHNSQDSGAIKMSNNRWMDKEEVVHVHNGILAMENNDPLFFEAPQMSLDIITKHEESRKGKDLYSMISLIGVI